MKKLTVKLAAIFLAVWFVQVQMAEACTGIKLKTKDGSIVQGRTVEFGVPVDMIAAVIPRNYAFTATTPNGDGLKYTSKYAVVGFITFNDVAIMDGMNEKGLCVGTFYFPNYADYTPTTAENQTKSLSPIDFPNWIVTQFATIDEVKAALSNVVIAPTIIKAWGGSSPAPFHYIVYDKSGNGLVIEPVDGKLVTYETKLGTFTNSPTFDWQMTNLRNFINLSPYNIGSITVDGVVLNQFGQGSGMVGMPGDFSPPSRFVRAAIYSAAATPVETSYEAVLQGFHVLNNFDIPIGISRERTGKTYASDSTQLTCMRDPNTLKYYFKTYANQAISMVDLTRFDLNAKDVKQWKVSGTETIVDVTGNLK